MAERYVLVKTCTPEKHKPGVLRAYHITKRLGPRAEVSCP